MWVDVWPINIYAYNCRQSGSMALHMFDALFLHAHDAQEVLDNPEAKKSIEQAMKNMRDLVGSLPFKPSHTPLAVMPNLEKEFFDYYYRGVYDEFWSQECNDFARYFDRHADIPTVYSGGWYDPFCEATTLYFAAMARQNSTPQRLIMSPWTHTSMRGWGQTWAGDVDFGPASTMGDAACNQFRLRWFDRWLKDDPNGVEDEPPVRIFVMGGGDGRKTKGKLAHGGRWRTHGQWPVERAGQTDNFLYSDGDLRPQPPGQ